MSIALAVGVAGAIGAVARYLVDGFVQDRTAGLFPFGTTVINVAGSLALGLVTGLALRGLAPSGLEVVLGVGFCGGFTTWSTTTWEAVRLAEEATVRAAARSLAVGVGASLVAAGTGLALGLAS